MLKAADLNAIQWGSKNWAKEIKDPATRARLRDVLLAAASDFDIWCKDFGSSRAGTPRGMKATMEKYMKDIGWM